MASILRKFHRPNFALAVIVFALVIFGLVMISSASVVVAKLSSGDPFYYVKRQAIWVGLGLLVLLIFQKIDYHFFKKIAPWALLFVLILLVGVFIPGLGYSYGGARRWIHLGPFFIQPTELLKPVFILYLAAWLEKKGKGIKYFSYGFLPFVIMLSFIVFLIMREPDMGTMFVIASTACIIFFTAGASIWQFASGFILGIFAFWELIKMAPYRLARFMVFLNPSADPTGIGYHVNQALLAIGSGGIFGRGFGESRQKFLYLPQAFSDSIFAIIAEELGFLRTTLVLILFILFALYGIRIAQRAPDTFGRLVATGIVFWICLQALINVGAMVGVLPLTGITLPFISYGGSSLVTTLGAVGILLNISRQTKTRYGT